MKQIALVASYDTPDSNFPGIDLYDHYLQVASTDTLTNTRWHFLSDRFRMTIDFGPGGNAICVDETGLGALVSWAETPDGHFVVQWDPGICGTRVNETLFGVYNENKGSGMFYTTYGMLEGFNMNKDQ